MPGTYAHYAFGKKVLAQLDDEIKNIILKNMDLFFIMYSVLFQCEFQRYYLKRLDGKRDFVISHSNRFTAVFK